MIPWNKIVEALAPYVVRIETPTGHGTGYLCYFNETKTLCGVATALHVVWEVDRWKQPMRIHSFDGIHSAFLDESDRVIFPSENSDSAIAVFGINKFSFPQELIDLRPIESPLPIGTEVGWLGFPCLEPNTLCFFSGNISARLGSEGAYLIDGVAINGVSGGPVICYKASEDKQFVGAITAYHINRQGGDALPGLAVANDISHFHHIIKDIGNIEEAIRKRREVPEPSPRLTGTTSPPVPFVHIPQRTMQTFQP